MIQTSIWYQMAIGRKRRENHIELDQRWIRSLLNSGSGGLAGVAVGHGAPHAFGQRRLIDGQSCIGIAVRSERIS